VRTVTASIGNCNIFNIVSTFSGKLLLVSNGTGKKSMMRCFRICSVTDEFATPNNMGNSAAMVSGTVLLLSNGNTANSAVRASGRLSVVLTGKFKTFKIVSMVSGRVLLVSSGKNSLMRCFRICSIASGELAPNNIGNSAAMVSDRVLLLSNGNRGNSETRASGRLSVVFTGKFNIFKIVSICSGKFFFVSNGTSLPTSCDIMVSLALPKNVGNIPKILSCTVLSVSI